MDAATLRAAQAPLKQRYRDDPTSAITPLHAVGDFSDSGITCTVRTSAGSVLAGLHPATGGDGTAACSGDVLLQAIVACTGVTLRSVATAMGIDIRSATLHASAEFDARGTLGISREVAVGATNVAVAIDLDTDADDEKLDKLRILTERFCVVGQTLRETPTLHIRRVVHEATTGGRPLS